MTIGEMAKSMLVRLEWFDTRFPRIPVNVQVRHTIFDNYSYTTGIFYSFKIRGSKNEDW